MSGELKMLKTLTCPRTMMWILGLYHGIGYPKYPFFVLRGAATITMTALFPILILTKILLWKTDFSIIAKQLSFFFVLSWVIMRVLMYLSALPKQRTLEDFLRNDIFNMQDERQQPFISSVAAKQTYLVKSYLPLSIMAVLFFTLPPIVNQKFANIPIWTPFTGDTENLVIYIFESAYLIVQGVLYPTMDCIFAGFTSIVTAQIGILKDNLKHTTDRDSKDEYTKQEYKIEKRLRRCIVHHKAILNLTRRLEDLFSSTLFCQIVFAALEVCFCGMQLLTETNRGELLFWWLAFVGLIGELMVSCWFAQEIITESSGIIQTCYMSEWYTCTPSTRKVLFIIMEQAKRPITLNGGYFFTLSFDTFLKVLRSAYSYYAVFSHVYGK